MKVLVYVEGPSDKFALEAVLRPLLERKCSESINILFFHAVSGDRKEYVLTKVPRKAVHILKTDPRAVVIALPDLYPKDKAFPHTSPEELRQGVLASFAGALREKRINDRQISERFRVFCLKHDLEALLLASKEPLRARLGFPSLSTSWAVPVEDQDHDRPPSAIVEELFQSAGKMYRGQIDAPAILSGVNYKDLMDLCPQCFKPFVEFLEEMSLRP